MNTHRKYPVLLGATGCLFICLYFFLTSVSPVSKLFRQETTKAAILQQAQEALVRADLADLDMFRRVELGYDKDLLVYAQRHLDNQLPDSFFPVTKWLVTWTGEVETKKIQPEPVFFSASYDYKGRMVGMEFTHPMLNRPPNHKESQALKKARKFLRQQGVEVNSLTLLNTNIRQDNRVLTYMFTFSRPSPVAAELEERYEINITGRTPSHYRAHLVFDPDHVAIPAAYKDARTYSFVTATVLWVALSIFIIVLFLKRLKRDVIEFKVGLWLSAAACLMVAVSIAIEAWPNFTEALIGGGMAGLLAGLAVAIACPVGEAFIRENDSKILELADVLVRGFVRVRELGFAVHEALFLSGAVLFYLAATWCLAGLSPAIFIEPKEDILRIFLGKQIILTTFLVQAVYALLIGLTLFLFFFPYLSTKIRNQRVRLGVTALGILLFGFHLYGVEPTFVSFLILAPVAVFVAYSASRFNFITILLSLFVVHVIRQLQLVSLLPHAYASPEALAAAGFLLLVFSSAVYFTFSKRSVEDFQHYVPDYLRRVSERERFLKELEIARTVQLKFLPQSIPSHADLEISCICQPAMEVGGDYYDFIRNGQSSIGVIIGDVSGKGVSAAFYMTMAKGIIKTIAKSTSEPKEILARMNTVFYENVPKQVFISVIYGEFDMQRRILKFARAGHNPLLVYKHATQETRMIMPKGLAIGLDGGQVFSQTIEEIQIPLEKDDVFIFYTDGISEAMNSGGFEFGEERLKQIISGNHKTSAQTLSEQIRDEVLQFTGEAEQHDDLTMVTVRVTG